MAQSKPRKKTSPSRAKKTKSVTKKAVPVKKSVKKAPKKKTRSHSVAIVLTLSIACVLLVLGNVFFWAGNTLLNTNKYVSTVGPLIEQPEVQTAVAQYTTTKLFNSVDVQGYISQNLPPKASFLAPQLTTQLKTYTQKTIQTILANSTVQKYWYSSLTASHKFLVTPPPASRQKDIVKISDIYGQVVNKLANSKIAFLSNKNLSQKVGSVQITVPKWIVTIRRLSKNMGLYQTIITVLFVAFTALSIWLASDRRRMAIKVGGVFAFLMLVMLVSIRIAGSIVVSHVNPSYQSAVQIVFSTVFEALRVQTIVALLVSLLIMFVAWISGDTKTTKAVKSRFDLLINGKLHGSLFGKKENALTIWVGKHKRYLEWADVVIIALIMLLVTLSPGLVLLYGVLMLLGVVAVEALAA